jgi:hypothetical protein
MNAVLKPRASARTVADLTAEIIDHERQVAEAREQNSRIKGALPGYIAGGDRHTIGICRKELAATEARIREGLDAIQATREAIRIVQQRADAAAAVRAYSEIRDAVMASQKQVQDLGASLTAFTSAYTETVAGLKALEDLQRAAGIAADPYALRAKLDGIVEMALYLETAGALAKSRTLESALQIRQSKRASLAHAADEFQTRNSHD